MRRVCVGVYGVGSDVEGKEVDEMEVEGRGR